MLAISRTSYSSQYFRACSSSVTHCSGVKVARNSHE